MSFRDYFFILCSNGTIVITQQQQSNDYHIDTTDRQFTINRRIIDTRKYSQV